MPLSRFPRLVRILASDEGEVHASATFSRRKDHIVVAGRIRASWPLDCQRCLEPMRLDVDEPYELVFVDSEAEARDLPDAFDPVVLDDAGQIHLVDLFEDELILRVPAIPKHEEGSACELRARELGVLDEESLDEPTEDAVGEARRNPFDVLKNLNIH